MRILQFGILEFLIGIVAIAIILTWSIENNVDNTYALIRVGPAVTNLSLPGSSNSYDDTKAQVAAVFTSDESIERTLRLYLVREQEAVERLLRTVRATYPGDGEVLRLSISDSSQGRGIEVLNTHLSETVSTISAARITLLRKPISPSSNRSLDHGDFYSLNRVGSGGRAILSKCTSHTREVMQR